MKQVALVTGSAQGLGRAIAERLAAAGVQVVVSDLDGAAAERVAQVLTRAGAGAIALPLDVADEGSVARTYADIEARFGRLDILVNNAGIPGLEQGRRAPIEATSLDTWQRTLRVNLTGTLLMCRGAVPIMKRGGFGRIVNISSRAARVRGRDCGAYAASKAAVLGLSQVLAGEVGGDGITVNCVAPSTVLTAMTHATSGGHDDYFERAAGITAVGRLGQAADVAEAVAYFCSPEAAFVTGTVLDVNGGSFMA